MAADTDVLLRLGVSLDELIDGVDGAVQSRRSYAKTVPSLGYLGGQRAARRQRQTGRRTT